MRYKHHQDRRQMFLLLKALMKRILSVFSVTYAQ